MNWGRVDPAGFETANIGAEQRFFQEDVTVEDVPVADAIELVEIADLPLEEPFEFTVPAVTLPAMPGVPVPQPPGVPFPAHVAPNKQSVAPDSAIQPSAFSLQPSADQPSTPVPPSAFRLPPSALPSWPLPTRDPVSGGEMIVTRLECPTSGVRIEGRFGLGWIGKLSPEQVEFVGFLAMHRGNVQKVAASLGIAYNTARSRLEDIGAVLSPAEQRSNDRLTILNRLGEGEINVQEALKQLRGG